MRVPKLWNETIGAHREAVQEGILDASWELVSKKGLPSVTMSQIAAEAGIGRATLYKYFSSVEAILAAWHLRHVAEHLAHLTDLRDRTGNAGERLEAVLRGYAAIMHHRGHQGAELVALLHRGEPAAHAQQQLRELVRELLIDAANNGEVRDDVAPDELADYCLHALTAAGAVPSEEAADRLVKVTLSGLRRRSR